MGIVVTLGIVLGIAFLIQIILSMIQMKHFSSQFVKLRKQGKVAIGRKSGGFFAGAIVMFLIDENGTIVKGKKMEGLTCLARVKDYDDFNGRFVGGLKEDDGPDGRRNLKKALLDAANNYNTFESGEVLKDPPSPAKKLTGLIKDKTNKEEA